MRKREITKIVSLLLVFIFTAQIGWTHVFALEGEENNGNKVIMDEDGIINEDNESPVFNGIEFSKNVVKVGETLTIKIDAYDQGAGIERVYGGIYVANNYQEVVFSLDEVTGNYIYSMEITEEMKYSKVRVEWIEIQDKSGNTRYLYGEVQGTVAYVSDATGSYDAENPILNAVTFDKEPVLAGETVEISIDAQDTFTGINKVEAGIGIGNNYTNYIFEYDQATNKYKINIETTKEMVYKKINISWISIYDNAGNRFYEDRLQGYQTDIVGEEGIIDNDAPKFNGVEFSSSTVKPGDVLDIYADISDDVSGIERVNLDYYIGDINYNTELSFDEISQSYKYSVNITNEMQYKQLKISQIYVTDNAGNYINLYGDVLSQYKVNITDESDRVDTTAPVLNGITMSKNILSVGDRLTISVDASDDLSGVGNIYGGIYIGEEWLTTNFIYDEVSKKFLASIDILDGMQYKKIKFTFLNIYDKAGNEKYFSDYELDKYIAYVAGDDGKIDDKPPVYNKIVFNKKILKPGETLEILVDAKDEVSGINRITCSASIGNEYINFELVYDSITKKYKYSLDITSDMVYKIIKINYIEIFDNAGNSVWIANSDLGNQQVNVVGESGLIDNDAPEFKEINFNKRFLKPGEALEVTVDAIDELSGIEKVKCSLKIANDYVQYDLIYDETLKKYKTTIDITEEMLYAKIKVNSLNIFDKAGNEAWVHDEDVSNAIADVKDENGVCDDKKPVLLNVNFTAETLKVGDTLQLLIDAKDEISGISHIEISYYIGDRSYYERLNYNEVLNRYEFELQITKEMVYKTIRLDSIRIYDKAGNQGNIYSDNIDCGWVQILNDTGEVDNKIPIYNGLIISTQEPKVGEKVTILVDAKDEKSGVGKVKIEYTYEDYWHQEYMEYDYDLQKYRYDITVTPDMAFKVIELKQVTIMDNGGSSRRILLDEQYNIYTKDLTGNVDKDKPEIISSAVSESEALVNSTVKIQVEAKDKTSGIKSVFYEFTNNGTWKSIELKYNDTIGKYEGKIKIDESMVYSSIKPERLAAYDMAGNYVEASNKVLDSLIIKVPGEDGRIDDKAPMIKSVGFNKEFARVGEEIKLSIEAYDDISGVKDINVGLTSNEEIKLEYNILTGKYEGVFKVKAEDEGSNILISYIWARDFAGNSNDRYFHYRDVGTGEMYSVKIADKNGNYDKEKPILVDYAMSKENYKNGETPFIKLNISETGSGLRYVEVTYRDDSTLEEYVTTHNFYGNNIYSSIPLVSHRSLENAKYSISKIIIADMFDNKSEYTDNESNFTNLNFKVGSYIENSQVEIDTDNVCEDDTFITGKTSKGGIRLKLFEKCTYENNTSVQLIDEVTPNYRGDFRFIIDRKYSDTELLIEAYDLVEGKLIGYETIKVNKSSDVNRDGVIDIEDIANVSLRYGLEIPVNSGGKEYFLRYCSDINNDLMIDLFDIVLVSTKI